MNTVQFILETKGSDVATIEQDATVIQAAEMMARKGIGSLVVTDGTKAVGIFTERDLMSKVVAAGRHCEDTKVRDVMTSPVVCCRRDTPLTECEGVMMKKGIRHFPIVEGGRLFGLISARDLVAAKVTAKESTIKNLETSIEELNEYLYTRT